MKQDSVRLSGFGLGVTLDARKNETNGTTDSTDNADSTDEEVDVLESVLSVNSSVLSVVSCRFLSVRPAARVPRRQPPASSLASRLAICARSAAISSNSVLM